MITFRRVTLTRVRSSIVDGVYYGIIEDPDYSGGPTMVRLGARHADRNVRLGEPWEQVSPEDDEARARALIAEHHASILGRQHAA